MGLFSKKSDKSSEFDRLPDLPSLPKSISSYQPISAPQVTSQPIAQQSANKWNIAAVKEAVSGNEESINHTQDFSDGISSGERGVNIGMDAPRTRPMSNFSQQQVAPQRREPLFVRIDKFENALRDFEDISIKIKRVEELITEIKQLREREDREFSEWEKDLQVVKSRLDSIDRTLFSQLD